MTWNSRGLLTRLDWFSNSLKPQDTSKALLRWQAVIVESQLSPPMVQLMEELKGYFFLGEPIGQIPWDAIDREGWTEFQEKVFRTISAIPHGETRTYAWVARRAGKPPATRAVGQALRKNPIPILIPCHRVVSEAALGGFMGCDDPMQPEVQLKQKLLELETRYLNPTFAFLNPPHGLDVSGEELAFLCKSLQLFPSRARLSS